MKVEHLHKFLNDRAIILALKGQGFDSSQTIRLTGIDRQRVFNIYRNKVDKNEELEKSEIVAIAKLLKSPEAQHVYISHKEMTAEDDITDRQIEMDLSLGTATEVLGALASGQYLTAYNNLMRNLIFSDETGYDIQNRMGIISVLKDSFRRAEMELPDTRLEEWLAR